MLVKRGGGGMGWFCRHVNWALILELNMRPSVQQLKVGHATEH